MLVQLIDLLTIQDKDLGVKNTKKSLKILNNINDYFELEVKLLLFKPIVPKT